jgi:gliding motility-associated-like protein
VIITYNEAPSVADAGPDLFACGEQISLQASSPFIGFGIWEGLNGSPPIADSTNPNATLPNFLPGTWNYIWTTQNGFCISQPDTIAITVYGPPDPAVAGTDILGYNTTQALDADPINTGIGTWSFVQGSGDIDDIHDPHTNVHNLAVGVNILRWTASNGTCPENADELRIEILQLEVPNGFSPNGDGVNDNFEITGLNEFENVSIEVFNRWGNQVYLAKQYENNWNGTDANGKQVPEDIYYYVLKADSDRIFTGFIAVKRSTP